MSVCTLGPTLVCLCVYVNIIVSRMSFIYAVLTWLQGIKTSWNVTSASVHGRTCWRLCMWRRSKSSHCRKVTCLRVKLRPSEQLLKFKWRAECFKCPFKAFLLNDSFSLNCSVKSFFLGQSILMLQKCFPQPHGLMRPLQASLPFSFAGCVLTDQDTGLSPMIPSVSNITVFSESSERICVFYLGFIEQHAIYFIHSAWLLWEPSIKVK